jgi:hypothetical protein
MNRNGVKLARGLERLDGQNDQNSTVAQAGRHATRLPARSHRARDRRGGAAAGTGINDEVERGGGEE